MEDNDKTPGSNNEDEELENRYKYINKYFNLLEESMVNSFPELMQQNKDKSSAGTAGDEEETSDNKKDVCVKEELSPAADNNSDLSEDNIKESGSKEDMPTYLINLTKLHDLEHAAQKVLVVESLLHQEKFREVLKEIEQSRVNDIADREGHIGNGESHIGFRSTMFDRANNKEGSVGNGCCQTF